MADPVARWYFDLVSPFAWLMWQRLRRDPLPGVSIQPVPVLLAGLLDHHSQKGPAEIPAKRGHTYRLVHWQARAAGLPLRFPPAHPFNPLPALRLVVALGSTPEVVDALLTAIWADGALPTPELLTRVAAAFDPRPLDQLLGQAEVKATLLAHGEAAKAAGVFGVPTLILPDGRLYFGNDSLDMLRADWSAVTPDPEYARLEQLPVAASRI